MKVSKLLSAVSRLAGRAIMDYGMLQEGDRVAVAVSGGKDSLSLLHVLRDRRRVSPVDFQFTAVHIDFGFQDFSPEKLLQYLGWQGFPYLLEKAESAPGEKWEDIDCFRWSRRRRSALFRLAGRMKFNKIAFGHHLDDIVETVLLNQFYRGEIGAMKPRQELFGGRITIIRPLAYERESTMTRLAEELGIHAMGQSRCARDGDSQRAVIKAMLREMEQHNPQVIKNIFRSLQNVRHDYLLDVPPVEEAGVIDAPEARDA